MRKLSKRNGLFLALAKGFMWPAVKTTSFKHYDIPSETLALMEDQRKHKECSLVYAGPHRSMWETIGIPYAISWHDGDLPFALMGNNLLKKETGWKERVLKHMVERIGGIMVERENNPQATVQSLVDTVNELLQQKRNIMVFPEGTRSRDGLVKQYRPATFQGIIDAANHTDVYVIPVNVDYSHLIELRDFMQQQAQKYTFRMADSKHWRKTSLGDVYLSFGKPIIVQQDDDRKDLASRTREACLGLVKIQPINILSEAVMRLGPEDDKGFDKERLYASIEDVLADLEPHHDKYRGFSARRSPEEIVDRSRIDMGVHMMAGYSIYANNIRHYLEK